MHTDTEKEYNPVAVMPYPLNDHGKHIHHLREAARHHESAAAHHAMAANAHTELAEHHRAEHRREQSRKETSERIAEVQRSAHLD